ncbi:hypothetical protein [Catellatospora tritici]|uniref:hypothetical protein n=1 Tax=Catellatospora tritici TaxID=2851566 RepID=UPI001C2CEF73|nr:hypothetical protein [Catellatospora tritici]MBV1855156.1 hypothetical protein [Catellatospora tritici]
MATAPELVEAVDRQRPGPVITDIRRPHATEDIEVAHAFRARVRNRATHQLHLRQARPAQHHRRVAAVLAYLSS